ncbi:hypothetical protein, partial [Klebsiella pneumoniae]|uniref:hypothetical protein n=1 Tax=Klebsiella pneumoniae TaxID=573 RepID=UPI00298CCE46
FVHGGDLWRLNTPLSCLQPPQQGKTLFCTVYASGIQAASALRRGSMFDVMEQQRCYAAGQSP